MQEIIRLHEDIPRAAGDGEGPWLRAGNYWLVREFDSERLLVWRQNKYSLVPKVKTNYQV